MLRFAEVSMGEGGVVACSRCAAPAPAAYRSSADVIADVEAAVSAWDGPGRANLSLAGADPFNHPDLPEIVAAAVGAGVSRLRVETAGAALGVGDNAPGAQSAGVRHACVTLLGNEGVHDVLAGAPGLFGAACAGMRAWTLAAQGSGSATFLSGAMPVCDHNAAEAPAVVAAFAGLGAREVTLRASAGLDVQRAGSWLAAACDTGTVNRVWVRVTGVPAEALPGHVIHLTPTLPRGLRA